MNARRVTGLLSHLLEPCAPRPQSFRVAGPNIAGRAFRGTDLTALTVMAHASSSSASAERLRMALIDGAARVQSDLGVMSSQVEAMPTPTVFGTHPATVLTWATWTATEHQVWVAGYLRRGRVTWEVLAASVEPTLPQAVVTSVALDVLTREPHSTAGSLWDLLPTAVDLPLVMTLDAVLGEEPVPTSMLVAA
jgi:hypothetical protein